MDGRLNTRPSGKHFPLIIFWLRISNFLFFKDKRKTKKTRERESEQGKRIIFITVFELYTGPNILVLVSLKFTCDTIN